MTYVSRHAPYVQSGGLALCLGEKIRSTERYGRYYDIAWKAINGGDFRIHTMQPGNLLFREADPQYNIEQAQTIPPTSGLKMTNRYSGRRLGGRLGVGGLYLATPAGLLREHTEYKYRGTSGPPRLVIPGDKDQTRARIGIEQNYISFSKELRFHAYRVKHPLSFADLSLTALYDFFLKFFNNPSVRKQYLIAPGTSTNDLARAVIAPDDYSASRGMADAIADTGKVAGIYASSARGDSDTGAVLDTHSGNVEGYVYVVFGSPGAKVLSLEPIKSFSSYKELEDEVPKMVGYTLL